MPGQILNKKLSSVSNIILILSALSFFLFYLVLSFYNRPASDDILFVDLFKQKGPVDFVKDIYNTWSGRWAPLVYFSFLLNLSDSFQNIHHYIFIYYGLTLALFIYSVNSISRFVINKIFKSSTDVLTTITYSVLFIAGFYFFTFEHIEAWWWLCSSFAYLQGIVFLLFGTALLLKENKNPAHYILIGLSFIYVGSCSEIYALVVLSLFICAFIYKLKIPGGFTALKNNLFFKGFVVAFISFLLSAIICFMAPGNLNRLNKEFPVATNPSAELKHTQGTFLENIYSQKKYPAAIAICSLCLLLGMKLKRNSKESLDIKYLKKVLIFGSIPLFIAIIIAFGFQFFILKNSELPLRTWTFTSFSLSVFCSLVFIVLGYCVKRPNFFTDYVVKLIIPGIVFIVLALNLYKQFNYANTYAKAYDDLIILLLEKKNSGEKDPLFVSRLPDPGMLVYLDLENKNITAGLQSVMELDYEINVKK